MRPASLFALLLLVTTTRASAESSFDGGHPCTYELDGDVFTEPPPGDVPVNQPVFLVRATGGGFTTDAMMLRVSDGTMVATAGVDTERGRVLVPLAPLVAGELYDLVGPACATAPSRVARYRAIEAGPISLGSVVIEGPYAANRRRGPQYRETFFVARLALDPSIEPHASLLRWTVRVDGGERERVPLDQFIRLPVRCGSEVVFIADPVPFGEHTFDGVAGAGDVPTSDPAIDAIFVTDPVTATVGCSGATRVDWATLRPLTPDEIAFWDTVDMDGGAPPVGTLDGGRMDMPTEPDTNSSCAVARGGGSRIAGVLLAISALVWASRRRGRRSS